MHKCRCEAKRRETCRDKASKCASFLIACVSHWSKVVRGSAFSRQMAEAIMQPARRGSSEGASTSGGGGSSSNGMLACKVRGISQLLPIHPLAAPQGKGSSASSLPMLQVMTTLLPFMWCVLLFTVAFMLMLAALATSVFVCLRTNCCLACATRMTGTIQHLLIGT